MTYFFYYAFNLKHLQEQRNIRKRSSEVEKIGKNLVKLASRCTEGMSAVEMHVVQNLQ